MGPQHSEGAEVARGSADAEGASSLKWRPRVRPAWRSCSVQSPRAGGALSDKTFSIVDCARTGRHDLAAQRARRHNHRGRRIRLRPSAEVIICMGP